MTKYVYKPMWYYWRQMTTDAPIPAGMVLVKYSDARFPFKEEVNRNRHIAIPYLVYCIIPIADWEILRMKYDFTVIKFS